jgi:DNA-binding transcriptional MerR regulator
MAHYSIRDLERLTGIKAHTIRIWEKRYGLIEPERTSTNIREYCDVDLKRLLNISILNKNGFKISKIANLSTEQIAESINSLNHQTGDAGSFLENLTVAMIDLDEPKFERILTRSILQLGFEDTFVRILNPFFVQIGIMWQTGSISPVQEHFVSNLVRQKILVATDNHLPGDSLQAKTFLLFLPEGEMHELGLLFANYLIRKKGHRVIYLGQNIPINDLKEVENIKHADYILTSFITSFIDCDIVNYLKTLTGIFPNKTIYLTGDQVASIKNTLPGNIKYLNSPNELLQELEQIK